MPPRLRFTRTPRVMLALLGAVLVLACTPEPAAEHTANLEEVVAAEMATPAGDVVDLTVYFRKGRGADAFLAPVVRQVPVSDQLPQTAVELLVAGPRKGDGKGLHPVLPASAVVQGLDIDDASGTATVSLSRDAVKAGKAVASRPEHEVIALAALANTLTEFPEIARVALQIDGRPARRLWGGWGVPKVLVRDASLITPTPPRPVIPDLQAFSLRRQRVGLSRASAAAVDSVRLKPRATYLRVSLDLRELSGDDLIGPAPTATVHRRGGDIVLRIRALARPRLAGEQALNDPAFRGARVDVRTSPPVLRVTIRAPRRAPFSLRTMRDPARVVLDIQR